jgi:hypothetical protein
MFAGASTEQGGSSMKYFIAWILGVPGSIILIWFLANQACS